MTAGDNSSYAGILGLGKAGDINTNFVIEWANENHQTACAIYTMGFTSSDSIIQFGIDATASYNFLGVGLADADVWSLSVTEFSVNSAVLENSVAGYAMLDNTAQFIGVPQDVWDGINITQYDFFCYNSTNCYTLQNCSVVASMMYPISLTITGDSAAGFSDFSVPLSPEFYLWQNSTTGYCDV